MSGYILTAPCNVEKERVNCRSVYRTQFDHVETTRLADNQLSLNKKAWAGINKHQNKKCADRVKLWIIQIKNVCVTWRLGPARYPVPFSYKEISFKGYNYKALDCSSGFACQQGWDADAIVVERLDGVEVGELFNIRLPALPEWHCIPLTLL